VPAMPSSSREARSGELAVKYGPSVTSAVSIADVAPPLHASVDAVLVSLLLGADDDVSLAPALLDGIVVGAVVVQATSAITHIAARISKIVFLFIYSLHFQCLMEYICLLFEWCGEVVSSL
jgi:hypothetical protein